MKSVIDIQIKADMTAEEKLEQIAYPVENLQLMLSALTKMHIDHSLSGDELTALFNTLHKQVLDIQRALKS